VDTVTGTLQTPKLMPRKRPDIDEATHARLTRQSGYEVRKNSIRFRVTVSDTVAVLLMDMSNELDLPISLLVETLLQISLGLSNDYDTSTD
jgi:hypothetical protein